MGKKNNRPQPYPQSNPERQSIRQAIISSLNENETDECPSYIPNVDEAPQIPSTSQEGNLTNMPPFMEEQQDNIVRPTNSQQLVPTMHQFNQLQSNVNSMSSVLNKIQNSIDKISNQSHSASNRGVNPSNILPVTHVVNNSNNAVTTGQAPAISIPSGSFDTVTDAINSNQVPIEVDELMGHVVDEHITTIVDVDSNSTDTGNYKKLGRPLDLKLSDATKQKIWTNQYVEFDKLIDVPVTKTPSSLELVGGKLVTVKPTKQISSIGQWCDAFNVYHTCYSRKFPHQTPELLSYLNIIKSLSQRNGDYITYDREFRFMRQTSDIGWGFDSTLWMECRDPPNKPSYNKTTSNSKPKNKRTPRTPPLVDGKPVPNGFCHSFHGFGQCKRSDCKYSHMCFHFHCQQRHPACQCPLIKPQAKAKSNSS